MEDIFLQPHLAKEFENKGYLIVDLLTQSEVDDLWDFYHSLTHSHKTAYGFHVSLDNKDPNFVKQINDKVLGMINQKMPQYFSGYRLLSGRFLVKDFNKQGLVTPHQDWSFTNEIEQTFSATIWIPLLDVHLQNGALGVIQGSHRIYKGIRATPLPVFKVPFEDCANRIFPYLKVLEMRAGQALIMNNRLIHGSPPNLSAQPRIALGAEIIPANATLYHYYLRPDTQEVEQYEIDDTFFYQYSNAKLLQLYQNNAYPTALKAVNRLPYHPEQQTWEQVSAEIQSLYPHAYNPKLQQIFDYSYQLSDKHPFEHTGRATSPGPSKSVWGKVKSWIKQ